MARLSHAPVSNPSGGVASDPMVDLGRLLRRLDSNILRANSEQEKRLRTNEYERNKARFNIEFARTLLTRMEQEALSVKVHSRRQEMQVDLNRKREMLEQVVDRIKDFEEMAEEDEDDSSSEGEDLLGGIIATPSESMDSRSVGLSTEEGADEDEYEDEDEGEEEASAAGAAVASPTDSLKRQRQEAEELRVDTTSAPLSEPPPAPEPTPPSQTAPSQTLRSRAKEPGLGPEPEREVATTTGSSLFGDRGTKSLSQPATTEAILDHQRAEQEMLSESMLKMAQSLKESSQAFHSALEEDRDALSRAGKGLETSEKGIEAATRRMGALRKVTEGKGWWDRMMLYAMIYGLMVVLLLVVFVLPKLRF